MKQHTITLLFIVGARPNYMKACPLYNILKNYYNIKIIHTGQHYDYNMNDVFFEQLKMPKPDVILKLSNFTKSKILDNFDINNKKNVIDKLLDIKTQNIGQIGEIRDKLIPEIKNINPDLVFVYGDITSTLAGALATKMLNIKLAHIESGLRSGDLNMPEEINRILTDSLSDYFFVTEASGIINLNKENIYNNVFLVGNTMIDCLELFKTNFDNNFYKHMMNLQDKNYILFTLHRQSNVDNIEKLSIIMNQIYILALNIKIIFVIHPRTKKQIIEYNLINNDSKNIILCDPLGYFDFINLLKHSNYIITDSGGIQEEAVYFGKLCFTLRENTERPSTLIENGGTNILIHDLLNVKKIKLKNYNKLIFNNASKNILNIVSNYIFNAL